MNDMATDIAVQTSTQLIKDTLDALYTPLSKIVNVNRAKFLESFNAYCDYMLTKSSMVRTLYSKSKPMALKDIYVKTSFTINDTPGSSLRFSDTELVNKFASGTRIIVKGNGGSGKTIFLKHLWLSRFEKKSGKIPIYIELRRLNDLQSLDIITFCRSELQSDLIFGNGIFEKLCEAGKFEFIFDGFDEVAREKRKQAERQILDLSEKYRKCNFLASGREDDRFSAWGSYEIYTVSPLSIDDLKALIEKIPFDRKVKKKFLENLSDDFFEMHHSFLSSPLLAIMMLMTFNENAIIPSKLTTFYNHAFQTLLTWHDATKDSFERERSLTIDEFRRVFSTFCLVSYYEQAFEFDDQQLRTFIKKALDYHGIEVSVDNVQNDICESVNLLQKEGLKFIFVHRSFQEYFAAECAMQVISGKASEFLSAFAKRPNDSVFYMCHELHPELVFDKYLAPKISEALSSEFFKLEPKDSRFRASYVYDKFSTQTIRHDGELMLGEIRFRPTKEVRSVVDFVDLCNQMRRIGHQNDLGFVVFKSIIEAVQNTLSEAGIRAPSESKVKITIEMNTHDYKISIRNTGKEKISTKDINNLKSTFYSIFPDILKKADFQIKAIVDETKEFFTSLQSERQEKEKSIDEILGI
ncbi:NACHT domain-containing protein [Ruegeria lacuscaerulensis ITI-1157]|nr:NACHT domain-containing protein [Ruegeria lacuscaerulensis ITI-1157]